MNEKQYKRMHSDLGFIAALDQSGGSTPKALLAYGVKEDAYKNEDEMFQAVHAMRTRIITSPSFNSEKVLAAILFAHTMQNKIEDKYSGDYLWEEKNIVPFLKIDKGLADENKHVRLMKPIPELDKILTEAHDKYHIFGTKERSVILDYDEEGIAAIVEQQFSIAKTVCSHDMVPMIEPEVDIHNPRKEECEELLLKLCLQHLKDLPTNYKVMFKLTLPNKTNLYQPLMNDEHTVRVVALSGGYSQKEANEKLAQNHGMIASFSRALAQDLRYQQNDKEFDETLAKAVDNIYQASIK